MKLTYRGHTLAIGSPTAGGSHRTLRIIGPGELAWRPVLLGEDGSADAIVWGAFTTALQSVDDACDDVLRFPRDENQPNF
jgi:hypothetical protein